MTKIISPLFFKLQEFICESVSVALPLFRIMIPMIIVVKILKEMGAINILGQWLAPVMGIVGLPGSMGLVWAATLVAGFFPGIIVFADLAASEMLTVGQVTVLTSMMLIAHSLPVELQIANKAGPRWLSMGIFRIGGALLYGLILNQILLWGNWLTESSILLWSPKTGPVELKTWAWDQVVGLMLLFLILMGIMLLMKVLDKFGFSLFLQRIFIPLLSKLGIGKEATNITVIGITLGISYGGGLIIKESRAGTIPPKDIFFAMVLMGFFHSIVEDTLLMLLLGGSLWGLLVGRLIFALLAVWLLVRLLSLISEKRFERYFFKPKAVYQVGSPVDKSV
jgi:spore maturation protein SpmB